MFDRFADLPRFFFDANEEAEVDGYPIETGHFSSWWGGMQRRTYNNDAISDLYFIHEMQHTGSMVYIADLQFEAFKEKMFRNELEASVCSEIRAYFEMPTLREKSFSQEIFADRFLNNPYYQVRWKNDPARLIEEFKLLRRNVMVSQNSNDLMEKWIHNFSTQNDAWAGFWYHRYNQVEKAMIRLRDECETIGRKSAMDNFMSWLTSPEITSGTSIPFYREARGFGGMYANNKKAYDEDVAAHPPRPRPVNYAARLVSQTPAPG